MLSFVYSVEELEKFRNDADCALDFVENLSLSSWEDLEENTDTECFGFYIFPLLVKKFFPEAKNIQRKKYGYSMDILNRQVRIFNGKIYMGKSYNKYSAFFNYKERIKCYDEKIEELTSIYNDIKRLRFFSKKVRVSMKTIIKKIKGLSELKKSSRAQAVKSFNWDKNFRKETSKTVAYLIQHGVSKEKIKFEYLPNGEW